ncbi:Oligopeptide ABC transporter, periplasmic oligopeptide-binding protein oppA (TC 3.A.1.5.1) [Hyphomicrobiales bacterium]|nr:Oligopeptide ABC transporter, periplasmic oligopeptide-binding protein oppA (TC 3.A.1.5.1) [Hyphomicrobiales bacterium]CAH1666555.1 Oligopeptide ABC transporter, periplasmic oligopeptide-binding protein oppA (TC 3.A.1.5.1) [Hyphomicrobiales bacterium]
MVATSRRGFLAGGTALAFGAGFTRFGTMNAQAQASLLRAVQPWEIRGIRPSESSLAYTRAGISENLVGFAGDGSILPGLAESWSMRQAGGEWRLKLRKDALFHDGSQVTPQAVKASFERLLPRSLYIKAAGIRDIQAVEDEVVFSLDKPFGPFLSYMLDYSTAIFAPSAFGSDGEFKQPIATGPFRVTAMDLPRGITMARHDGYWGPKAGFAAAQFDAVPNGETRANIAIAGDAGVVMNLPTPSLNRLARVDSLTIDRMIVPRIHNIMPNCGKPQFADVRTRRALNMAIDRVGIATSIMRNPELAATQYFPPTLPLWYSDGLAPYRFDAKGANDLLDQAGWTRGADGIRSKDGVRFAGTMLTFANRPELPVIASALQAMFKAVGYDMAIKVTDYAAIYEGQRDGTLDLALSSRNIVVLPDPISTIATDFTLDEPITGGSGVTNWRNDEIRRDVAAYFLATEEEQRAPLRKGIARVIHDELSVIPVVWYDQIFSVAKTLEGFTNDQFEQRLYLDRVKARA